MAQEYIGHRPELSRRASIDDRVQAEARVARELMSQHPDMSRSDALRAAAGIVDRDYKAGRSPA